MGNDGGQGSRDDEKCHGAVPRTTAIAWWRSGAEVDPRSRHAARRGMPVYRIFATEAVMSCGDGLIAPAPSAGDSTRGLRITEVGGRGIDVDDLADARGLLPRAASQIRIGEAEAVQRPSRGLQREETGSDQLHFGQMSSFRTLFGLPRCPAQTPGTPALTCANSTGGDRSSLA
jgi:hypothetical protein